MSGTVGNNAGRDSGSVSDSLDATKLTGALPALDGSNLTGISTDTSALEYNQALLAFKVASANQLAKFQMVDQVIDEYQDATGIDASASTNESTNIDLGVGTATTTYYIGASSGSHTPSASGGTVTTVGDYTIHSFLSGSTSFTSNFPQSMDVLIVAGGGAGGGHDGAGAGAGGVRALSSLSIGSTATVVVGAGGTPGSGAQGGQGADGANSSVTTNSGTDLADVTTFTTGGGGGGSESANGRTGGSGGGGGGSGIDTDGASGNEGGFDPVEGYDGGDGKSASPYGGGSGGGAGAAGSDGPGTAAGGVGISNDYRTGSGVYYGGGGGNSSRGGSGAGGNGGGGSGTTGGGAAGGAGTANTGGGGGGGGDSSGVGGVGGSGIVVFKRLTTDTFVAGGADLTLQSEATTAESAPTTADLVILIEDGAGTATINTDIKAKVSRDGSAFSDYVTLEDEGDWGTDKRILVARNIDISGITSGVAMKYKIETLNQSAGVKETRIHATSLAWA